MVEKNVMRHTTNGEASNSFDEVRPWFVIDPHNLKLGFATDGLNYFGHMSSANITWHVRNIQFMWFSDVCTG